MARISGRVQGVGLRWWTREQAIALGLGGWVRNERDGSVTALISGPDTPVSTMIARLRIGPPGAAVARVATEPAPVPENPDAFLILR